MSYVACIRVRVYIHVRVYYNQQSFGKYLVKRLTTCGSNMNAIQGFVAMD